jgi:hypothetical protein
MKRDNASAQTLTPRTVPRAGEGEISQQNRLFTNGAGKI